LTKTTGSKKIRCAGRIPGILYGNGDPEIIELESVQFEKAIKSTNAKNFLVELEFDGSKSMALVQDVQKHPISRLCLHVDFRRLGEDSVVTADVPLIATGSPEGVKVGGILQTMLHNITLKGRPTDIPESVEVDTSHLQVGEGILLGELTLPDGITAVGNPKGRAIAVAASRITAKATEAEGGVAPTEAATEASAEEKKED
jgi:large subunit ribosomal protein L25